MIFNKIYTFLFIVCLVFQTTAAVAQTPTPDVKREKLTPKLKEDALELLSSVARETQQFRLPENRVRTRTIIADLMWEHDEQAARTIFQNALGELQNWVANINLPEGVEMNSIEKSVHFLQRYKLADVRREFVLALATRDSQAALDALATLKPRPLDDYDPLGTTELELQVTAAIVKKDPDKSYSVAKQQLDANGLTYQFVVALKDLYKKDSKLAANLGRDVLAVIKNSKIQVPPASGVMATVTAKGEIDFWQVSSFINAASELNRAATRAKEKKIQPVLTDAEMRELVEITANKFLTAPNPAPYSISQVMPEILRYAPATAQRVRLKIGAEASKQLDKVIESNSYYNDSVEKNADELAKIADVSAPEVRDSRYSFAAFKALDENEPEKAQAIAAHIKDRKNYVYLFERIEFALPLAKARRGDLEEVRRMLASLKTNQERIFTLTELASALAAKGEKETAKTLLDESLQMMPPILRKQQDLESTGRVAVAYSVAAPEQAFLIIENGIGQMNEYINSGIKLDDFYAAGAVESDELLFNTMNRQALLNVPNSFDLLKNLARADFERTVGLADKFERPEIRLFVRLRIAQALLDTKAAEKEDKQREQLVGDDEMN
jgi:hypothetical protein